VFVLDTDHENGDTHHEPEHSDADNGLNRLFLTFDRVNSSASRIASLTQVPIVYDPCMLSPTASERSRT
jgi:hypothetical protein